MSDIEIGTRLRLKARWANFAETTVWEVLDVGRHPRTRLPACRIASTTARHPQPKWVVLAAVRDNYDVLAGESSTTEE